MGRKVLLVDDEESIIEVLSIALAEAGFATVSATNGEEGIAAALVEKPDLVISDIVMPRMDGWDFCHTLRTLPSTKTIPFLFLTSLDQAPEKILAARLGADDYLTKPFDMKNLLEKVRQLAGRLEGREGLLDGGEADVGGERLQNIMVDTVEVLLTTGRTGVVAVQTPSSKGLVYIEAGALKHAVFEGRTGEDALFGLLRLPDCQVTFKEESHPDLPSNFTLTWQEIMSSLTADSR